VLEQCRTLAVKAVDYGPVTSLILSWVIDLFVNGSMSKKDLSGLTIGNYVSEASRLLFNELKGKDFSEWSDKDFSELYQKLIRGVSQGRQRNLASALTGWHRFLVNWFNFPPIASKLHNEVKMLPPHANVIWDHEYQLLQAWLSNAEMDQRLIMYLQVIFLIAFNIRIRTQELFRLKLCNFHIFDNQIEIRIYGTKTPAAKRVIIVNRHEFEILEKLILRRYSEGASSKDFLFGDPNALKKIYRLRALYSYALQLVKLVTGDQTVRFHTFSHSVITRQLKPILKGGSGDENNPFYQIATDSAHFSINTTCSEYCHQYEFAVRESIDRALKNIKITSGLCSKWTGEISATLRQKKKRMLKHQGLDYWDVVFASTKLNTFVPITIGLSLGNVEKPIILNSKQAIGAYKLLQIFNDLAENFDKETTSIRQNVPISRIEDYLVVLRQVIQAGKLSSKIDYESTLDELVICLRQGIKGISFKKPIKTPAALILQAAKKMTNLNGLVIDAWLSSFRFGFLELKSTERIRQFIKLLHALDIPVTHLAIAVSVKLELMEIKKIQSHFYEYYGSTVPQYIVESRGGRPPCYLKVSSTQVLSNQVPASATSSVAWLNAIFLTSLVWAQERASHE
jgi:integrase